MSVAPLASWRLPGCGPGCRPNSHSPDAHEQWGRLREREISGHTDALRHLVVRTGGILIDCGTGTLTVDEIPVHMTGIELAILTYLAEHLGTLCSVHSLLDAVWTPRYEALQQVAPSGWRRPDLYLARVHIARIRHKLGRWRAVIETTPGQGYRLLDIEPEAWLRRGKDDATSETRREPIIWLSVGKRIRALRQDCAWTQIVLANELGVTRETVAKWETDVCAPSPESLRHIADLFGVDIRYLVRGRP